MIADSLNPGPMARISAFREFPKGGTGCVVRLRIAVILGTNAVSAFADANAAVLRQLRLSEGVHLPVIVLGEYCYGVKSSCQRAARENGWTIWSRVAPSSTLHRSPTVPPYPGLELAFFLPFAL